MDELLLAVSGKYVAAQRGSAGHFQRGHRRVLVNVDRGSVLELVQAIDQLPGTLFKDRNKSVQDSRVEARIQPSPGHAP